MSDINSNNDKKSNDLIERHKRHDLITRQECTLILEHLLEDQQKKAELISYELVPELSNIGYLGEYFHLHVKYRIENESKISAARFFVKTLPYQNSDMLDFIVRSGIMKKEANLYEKLLNDLRKLYIFFSVYVIEFCTTQMSENQITRLDREKWALYSIKQSNFTLSILVADTENK